MIAGPLEERTHEPHDRQNSQHGSRRRHRLSAAHRSLGAGVHRAHRRDGRGFDRRPAARRQRRSHRSDQPDAGDRRAGPGALPEPAGRHLRRQGGARRASTRSPTTPCRSSAARRRRFRAKLGVAGTAETVNVTAATPVIDLKRDTTTTNVTLEELQNIPSSRDPWVVMQTVPTVYMDRVNVGGAESGQQSNYNAKGANDTRQHVEHRRRADHRHGRDRLLGVLLRLRQLPGNGGHHRRRRRAERRPAACSSTWFCARARNKPHGNARIYFENESLQAVNISPELAAALGNTTGKGNRTDKYQDYGFDLGGPLLKDRLWAWGTIARTDINLLTLTGDARQDDLQELRVQGRRRRQPVGPRQLHVLREQQDQERPQRRPDAAAGDRVEPDRPDQVLQGRRQLRRRLSSLFATAKVRARRRRLPAGAGRRPRQGLLLRRRRRGAQHVLPVPEQPSAGLRRRRRQLLRRQARGEVRRRVAQHAGRRRSRSGRRAI